MKGNIEWQESPEEMYLGNITRKIKGVHCHTPTEDDVSHLALCGDTIEDNLIEYWFTPKRDILHKAVQDQGTRDLHTPSAFGRYFLLVVFKSQMCPPFLPNS